MFDAQVALTNANELLDEALLIATAAEIETSQEVRNEMGSLMRDRRARASLLVSLVSNKVIEA